MTVSVVIPTYNRAGPVVAAIESVLRQTYDDLQVVVVDDGSTDDTGRRVADLADDRIAYLRQANRGVSAARNRGIAAATGEVVAFLDSDDVWMAEKLAHEVAFLRRHPEAAAVFSDAEKHDGDAFVPSFVGEAPRFSRLVAGRCADGGVVLGRREMELCLLQEVPVLPSAFAIRRAALERTGPFDEGWSSWEDWEFFLRLAGWARFGYVDRPLIVHRVSRDSLHRVDAERGRALMVSLLLRERRRRAGDPEALDAIRAGIVGLRKHIGWQRLRTGRRAAASASFLSGFRETGDVGLLLRAAAALVRGPRRRPVRQVAARAPSR